MAGLAPMTAPPPMKTTQSAPSIRVEAGEPHVTLPSAMRQSTSPVDLFRAMYEPSLALQFQDQLVAVDKGRAAVAVNGDAAAQVPHQVARHRTSPEEASKQSRWPSRLRVNSRSPSTVGVALGP